MERYTVKRKNKKKSNLIIQALLAFFLITLIVAFCIHVNNVNRFNEEEHIYTIGSGQDYVYADIHPRGLATDAWVKEFKGAKDIDIANALIYETLVVNNSDYDVSEWYMKISMPDECFINNGWCGSFEIHQYVDTEENVQVLNLQNPRDVSLDYIKVDQDLMIPLNKGDYFFYYPNRDVKEMPIYKPDQSVVDGRTISIGFIIYSKNEPPVFEDATLYYHLYENPYMGKTVGIYLLALILWLFLLAIFITSITYQKIMDKRVKQDNMMINSAVSVFTEFFEAKDSYTRGHSRRVAEYAVLLAKECGLDESSLRTIYHVAYMHDCGKCYIPDAILKKEGRLTDEEFATMKTHTVKGAEMVQDFTAIEGLQDGVRHHHERYDGKGYPDNLAGEDIPWIARVICIADSYDAMSSDRCYRKKLSYDDIIGEFKRCRGAQFDPELTDAFIKILEREKNAQ